MKVWNNTAIIAVDHGYGNIKTANTVTPTALTAYETKPVFSGNILEYKGMYYRIGEGHKEFTADKTTDQDYYLLTLMAVARELNIVGRQTANVHLAAGLPLTWVRRQRDSFRDYLMQNKDVHYMYNQKEYHVHFTGCSLFPQGYPAIINQLSKHRETVLLADIGNGTMNLLYLVNKKPQEQKCWTEKIGVNQCIIAARNAVMDTFGTKIDDAIIEDVLRFGVAGISKPYQDCITDTAKKYVADLFATLRRYEYNPDLMHLFVVGGGGCLIQNFGNYDASRVTIIDDIRATARGYEQLAYMSLRRKENV